MTQQIKLTELRAAIERAAESELESLVPDISPGAWGHGQVVAANLAVVLVSEVLQNLEHPARFTAGREDHITTVTAGTCMDEAVALIAQR